MHFVCVSLYAFAFSAISIAFGLSFSNVLNFSSLFVTSKWFLSDFKYVCSVRDSQLELVRLGTEKYDFSCANPRVRILHGFYASFGYNAPSGIRTRVTASKGQYDWPDYTNGASVLKELSLDLKMFLQII
jgi:hypothetical protein